MHALSSKFTYLEKASKLLPAGVVPNFVWVPISPDGMKINEIPLVNRSSILRSALKDEVTSHKMLSGKSVSVRGINNIEDFNEAYARIHRQKDLDSIILQDEIFWDRHITLWIEGEFIVGEQKDRNQVTNNFFYNPLTRSLAPVELQGVINLIQGLRPLLKPHPQWMLEIGVLGNSIHLFQVQPVSPEVMSRIFTSSLAFQQVKSQRRFSASQSLKGLIQMEWRAFGFRKKMDSGKISVSDVYSNWEFIFHYFRIHCMIHRLNPTSDAFAGFLSSAGHRGSHLGGILIKHIKVAQKLRPLEELPLQASAFSVNSPAFIGRGIISGRLDQTIEWHTEPDLGRIYSENPPKAILTASVGILSHAALACAELGVGLVMGLDSDWRSDKKSGAMLQIDFQVKRIQIE